MLDDVADVLTVVEAADIDSVLAGDDGNSIHTLHGHMTVARQDERVLRVDQRRVAERDIAIGILLAQLPDRIPAAHV